jgi:hypothetical protein
VVGAILILVALFVVIPVGVLMSGGALAGIIGFFVQKDVDDAHEGGQSLLTCCASIPQRLTNK